MSDRLKTIKASASPVMLRDPKTTTTKDIRSKVPNTIKASSAAAIGDYNIIDYAGHVKGGSSKIRFGESKFDVNVPFAAFTGAKDIDHIRARRQSVGGAFVRGLASRATSIIPKVFGGAGYVAGAIPWAMTGDISEMTENPLSMAMESFDEYLREALPVYASENYDSDNIFDVLSSQKFWFDDLFDGLAFAASAYVPGGAVGKASSLLGKAGKAMGAATKGAKLIKGAAALKKANPFIMTVYNTLSESGFEARDSQKSSEEKLIADGVPELEAKTRSSRAAGNTFWANFAILLAPNFIQSKFMLGGFKKSVKGMKETIRDNMGNLSKIQKSPFKKMGRDIAMGIASEGLWEEGMQTAVQGYETRQATTLGMDDPDTKERLSGYAEEWIDGFTTVEGQKSMILGAIIGGFMGGYSGLSSGIAEKKYISEFGEEWKEHQTEYIDKWGEAFTDRIAKVNDPSGGLTTEGTVKAFYQTLKDKDLFTEASAAAINSDEFHDKFNKRMAVARYMYGFLADTKHFDSTEESLKYAISRLDHMAEVEGTNPEDFAQFKEDAKKIKQAYDEVEKKNTRFINSGDRDKLQFHTDVGKALLFEQSKRDVLEEMKGEMTGTAPDQIDALIKDSNDKSNYLLSTKGREESFENYRGRQKHYIDLSNKIRKEITLRKELDNNKTEEGVELTDEQRKTKEEEINSIQYDTIENEVINGSKLPHDIDIIQESEVLEKNKLGLRNKSNFQKGMAYKKKRAREQALNDYNNGNAKVEDVYNAIVNNTDEETAPYTVQDEVVLEKLLDDIKSAISGVPDIAKEVEYTKMRLNILKQSPNTTPEMIFGGTDAYERALKNVQLYEDGAVMIPKIKNILDTQKAQNLEDNITRRESEESLQDEAMHQIIDESVDNVLSSYNSNPENFSNTTSVEDALRTLDQSEAGLQSEDRSALRESPKGLKLQKKIDSLRTKLNDILKEAQKNKGNKAVADENAKRSYGETRIRFLEDKLIFDILNKHLDDKATEALKDTKEDDMNFIHIEKLVDIYKKASKEDQEIIREVLKSRKTELLEEFKKEFTDVIIPNAKKLFFDIPVPKGQEALEKEFWDSQVNRVIPGDINKYLANPSSGILELLSVTGLYDQNLPGNTPFDTFEKNGNVGEFYSMIKALPDNSPTKVRRLNNGELKKFTKMHILIESIDQFEQSIDSSIDTLAMLKGEIDSFLQDEESDIGIAPSRQQRISIFELVRWFKTKSDISEKSDGFSKKIDIASFSNEKSTEIVNAINKFLDLATDEDLRKLKNNLKLSDKIILAVKIPIGYSKKVKDFLESKDFKKIVNTTTIREIGDDADLINNLFKDVIFGEETKKKNALLDELKIIEDKKYSSNEAMDIVENYLGDHNKKILNRIRKVLNDSKSNVNVIFSSANIQESEGGNYNPNTNTIIINSDLLKSKTKGFLSDVLVHEFIHSVTVHVTQIVNVVDNTGIDNVSDDIKKIYTGLSKEQINAAKQLTETLESLRKDLLFKNEYGLTNINELLAELANPEFRNKLKSKGLLNKIFKLIASILGKKTSYDEVSESFNKIMSTFNADSLNENKVFFNLTLDTSKESTHGKVFKSILSDTKGRNNVFSAYAYLKGLAGTGKTTVVAKLVMKLTGLSTSNVLAIANNNSATKTVNDSLGLTGKKTIQNIEESDITDDIKLIVLDEVGAMQSTEFKQFVAIVALVNEKRIKDGKEELKVLAMGDPTQLQGEVSIRIPIEDSNTPGIEQITVVTPLTIPFRSDISSILELQDAYHMSASRVEGIVAKASSPLGTNAKGVHVGQTKEQLVNQLDVHKDNGRSKVVVVSSDVEIEAYTKLILEKIPNARIKLQDEEAPEGDGPVIEIVAYVNVQGRTFGDVFADIDPAIEQSLDSMPLDEQRARNRTRNKIMYTVTSRAQDYIFLMDHTGMTNNTSNTITLSEENTKERAKEYKEQYVKDVNKDIRIMGGQPIVVPKPDDVKPDDPDNPDDENSDDIKPDDVEPVDPDDPEIPSKPDKDVPDVSGTDLDVYLNEREDEDNPDIHNVAHPKNSAKQDKNSKIGTSLPYKKGDKVVYVKIRKDGEEFVQIYAVTEFGYKEIGFLSDAESVKVFGVTVEKLMEKAEKSIRPPGPSGNFPVSLTDDHIVARGTINATPIPLAYGFSKVAKTGKDIFENAFNKVKKVFKDAGFTVGGAKVKIHRSGDVKKKEGESGSSLMIKGILPGIPYIMIEVNSKEGKSIVQHIKLAPKMLDKDINNELVLPLDNFLSAAEKIQDIIQHLSGGVTLGTKQFNDLIKAFKVNYKVSENEKTIERKEADSYTYDEAVVIYPDMSREQFDEIKELMTPLIQGFYGIGNVNRKFTQEEFDTEYANNPAYKKVEGEFAPDGGVWYLNETKEIYYKLKDTGLVQSVSPGKTKKGQDKLVGALNEETGYRQNHVMGKDLKADAGTAQEALNLLSKNNATPGGIVIRIVKVFQGEAGTVRYISGKSLLSSEASIAQHMAFLRQIAKKFNINIPRVAKLSKEDAITITEAALLDSKAITEEELNAAKKVNVGESLTTESLRQALGFKDGAKVSTTLRTPLKLEAINELGEDLTDENKEKLSELIESHFEMIVPTSVQIKIDKGDVIEKDDKKDEWGEEWDDDYKDDDEEDDDLLNDYKNLDKRRLDVRDEMELGKKLSKDEVRKIIRKRIPEITDEEIQFVETLAGMPGTNEKTVGMYVPGDEGSNGVIILKVDADGKVHMRVAKHEAFHKIWKERLSFREKKKLRAAFIKEFPKTELLNREAFEEFIAEKYQEWYDGKYLSKSNIIKNVFAFLRDFFRYVGNNKLYIESVFRDIDRGQFRKGRKTSLEGSSLKIRSEFKTSQALTKAFNLIRDKVNDVATGGFEGYPVSKNELQQTAKQSIYRDMQVINNRITKWSDRYERLLDKDLPAKEKEEKLGKIKEKIDEYQIMAEELSLVYKHYNALFDIVYPHWDVKSLMTAEEMLDEEDDEFIRSDANIADDIINWDQVDMEGKVSTIAKQFMSNIFYNGKYLKFRTAYKIALDLTNNLVENETSVANQISDRIKNESNPYVIAVGEALINLSNQTKDLKSVFYNRKKNITEERDTLKTGMFLNDGTFIYLTNPERDNKLSLSKYKGKAQLNAAGIEYQTITRNDVSKSGKVSSEAFIKHIIAHTNYTQQELFDIFRNYQNKDVLSSMLSNFLSQRERSIKFIKVEEIDGVRVVNFIDATGRRVYNTTKNRIKETLLEIDSYKKAKALSDKVKFMIAHKKKGATNKDILAKFLEEIGLGYLIPNLDLANIDDINLSYAKLEYLFTWNVFQEIFTEDQIAERRDEEGNKILLEDMTKDDLDSARAFRLQNEMSSFLNTLAKVANDNYDNMSASSVKSSDGKKKYLYVLSGQAYQILNSVQKFLGIKSSLVPKFIKSEYYSYNAFMPRNGKKALNKIYKIEDFDGTVESDWKGEKKIIAYSDEKFNNFIERSFGAQFLQAIADSSGSVTTYSQNTFTISNKPANISAKINVLKPKQAKEALRDMITQLTKTESLKNVSNSDKNKLVNMNIIAEAIEQVLGEYAIKPIVDDKNGRFVYYEMTEGVIEKLKGKEEEIANAAYDIIINKSEEFIQEILDGGIAFPVHNLASSKIGEIIDKDKFGSVDLNELAFKRIFNPITKKSEPTKERTNKLQFRETIEDATNRINTFMKHKKVAKTFNTYKEAQGYLKGTENADLLELQPLIPKELIQPIVGAFLVNDYINSRALTELMSGPQRFFKSANDLTKRLSGSSAPGLRGLVDQDLGMPEKTNVAIFEDEKFTVGTTIREMLRDGFGLSNEDIEEVLPLYGDELDNVEYTDAQGFMLPERYEDIVAGFGLSYGAGAILKPAYYHVDDNGVPRMLKYSSIVLTDALVNKSPALAKLRDKMRNGGENGDVIYGEAVFATGNKVGQPTNLVKTNELLRDRKDKEEEKDFFIKPESGFEINNIDYRLQLNPIHDVDSSVANPTQLGFFLNTDNKNATQAKTIYTAISKIITGELSATREKLSTRSGINGIVQTKLNKSKEKERLSEIYEYLSKDKKVKTPWNFPTIAENITIQIASYINKQVLQVRFPGAKLVLQTAFGTEDIRGDREEIERKAVSLKYNTSKSNGALYSEAIIPRGMLPKDIEIKIDIAIKEKVEIPEMYLFGDLLGFRIPSSELHSAIPLRVKGFYGTENTNVIIVPKTVVSLHGHDFDVDALYVIKREYYKIGNKESDRAYGYIKNDKDVWVWDDNFESTAEFTTADTKTQNKYYKNLIVENFLETITAERNRKRVSKPISMIKIKKDINEILKLKPESKDYKNDSSWILDRQKTHASSFEALQATGIFANAIKVLAYAQNSNTGRTQPKLQPVAEEEERIAISFNNELYDTLISNEELWDDLDAFLNSAIDNVNEQDLPSLNMTADNIKAYIAFRALGVGNEEALEIGNRVFAQNFVEYLNKTNDPQKLKKGFELILGRDNTANIKGNIPTKEKLNKLISSEFTLKELFDKANKEETLTAEEYDFVLKQYQIYQEFNRAMKIGRDLTKLAKVLNVIKQMPVTKAEIDDFLKTKDSIFTVDSKTGKTTTNSNFLFQIDDLLENLPHVAAGIKVVEESKVFFEENFYRYKKVVRDIVDRVFSNVKVEFEVESESLVEQRKNDEFIKFLLNSVSWDIKYGGFQNEANRIGYKGKLLTGEEAFKDRMFDTVETLQKHDLLKRNIFISGLSISRAPNGRKKISFDPASNMDYATAIDLENAFDQLSEYEINKKGEIVDSNISDREYDQKISKLQRDFMRYIVLEDGLMFTKDNYSEIIPLRMMKMFQKQYDIFMSTFESTAELRESMEDLFHLQVAAKNPNGLDYIAAGRKVNLNPDKEIGKYKLAKPGKIRYLDKNNKVVSEEETTIYADFMVKLPSDQDGSPDYGLARRTLPKYTKGFELKTESGRSYVVVYKRGDINDGDTAAYYHQVGINDNTTSYSVKTNRKGEYYDMEDAFRPDILNIRMKNPNTDVIESYNEIKIGTLVSATSFSDIGRQDKYFYTIESVKVKKGEEGESTIYTYRVKKATPPKSPKKVMDENDNIENVSVTITGMEFQTEPYKGSANIRKGKSAYTGIKPTGEVLSVTEELKRISIMDNYLAPITNILLSLNSQLGDKIRVAKLRKYAGLATFRDNKIATFLSEKLLNPRTEFTDTTIVHEELHRYTIGLYALYSNAIKKSIDITTVLTERELEFINNLNSLHLEYQKNPYTGKNMSDAMKQEILGNPEEFLAYGLTSQALIEYLKQTKLDTGESMLQKLINLLTQLLGGSPSIYDGLLKSFEILAEPGVIEINTKFREAPDSDFEKSVKEADAVEAVKNCGI